MSDLADLIQEAKDRKAEVEAALAKEKKEYEDAQAAYNQAFAIAPQTAISALIKRYFPAAAAVGGAGGIGAVVSQPGFLDNLLKLIGIGG